MHHFGAMRRPINRPNHLTNKRIRMRQNSRFESIYSIRGNAKNSGLADAVAAGAGAGAGVGGRLGLLARTEDLLQA